MQSTLQTAGVQSPNRRNPLSYLPESNPQTEGIQSLQIAGIEARTECLTHLQDPGSRPIAGVTLSLIALPGITGGMDYSLAIDGTPDSVPGGTSILLLHPSIGGTDAIDTGFLEADSDRFLVISTRTTAREVQQKLEHYDVDQERGDILDTLSVERGYSRRSGEHLHYVSAPDDVAGILGKVERFLDRHTGRRRISFDSVSELAYYSGEETAADTLERLTELLEEYDAIGLFHVSPEVHDPAILDRFEAACDAVIEVQDDGDLQARF